MSLLLDTHVLLWSGYEADALDPALRGRIADPATGVFVSAASAWEIAIKRRMGKLALSIDTGALTDALGFSALPISLAHAEAAGRLDWAHRDPFDRMLVAQAREETLTLVTADRAILAFLPEAVSAR
ncbi:MAG: type II toxin-antitoxin system VapC family toxin [Alphaproteobacteria bacterium]|nr:type II toxin-antitoxin system VapC family toxin [Alphaproteobacteria bacterium]